MKPDRDGVEIECVHKFDLEGIDDREASRSALSSPFLFSHLLLLYLLLYPSPSFIFSPREHSVAMHVSFRASVLLAAVAVLSCGVQAIPKVTRSGRYLYNEDGSRFYIKGVAYQEQGMHSYAIGLPHFIVVGRKRRGEQ